LSAALIEFFFEVTFIMPGRVKSKSNSDLSWEGIEYIQNELKKGKGVIITSLHLGHFLHPGKIILDSTYEFNGKQLPMFLGILSSAENEFLVREQAETYPNLDIIITDNFSNLKQGIENHLKKNHVVFVVQDFCNADQLRVPFIHGMKKYDFLMPCPQLLSYFHYKLGSPVIYCVNIPESDLSRTKTIYFPSVNLYKDPNTEPDENMRKELIRFQKNEMEEYERFGLISTEINRALNPYILQYPFFWEEVYPFLKRSSYFIDISGVNSIGDALEIISERMIAFLKNSFEPGRNTTHLISCFEKLKIESGLMKSKSINDAKLKQSYDLGRMNTIETLKEIKKIIEALLNDLDSSVKSPIEAILSELIVKL
jgi:lauroyl/myristoyl acyltransferase